MLFAVIKIIIFLFFTLIKIEVINVNRPPRGDTFRRGQYAHVMFQPSAQAPGGGKSSRTGLTGGTTFTRNPDSIIQQVAIAMMRSSL
jgi:hypothetical protein